jgi:hypothetical protein
VADLKNPIPLTKMALRYGKTKSLSDAKRRDEAKKLADDPAPLARDFADSVRQFGAEYDRPDEPFFPTPRDPPHPKISRTEDLAWLLWKQGMLPVDDSELDADYVEYELVATRTPGRATFEKLPGQTKAKTARSALRLDLLLANHSDRTPVVAEVKRRRDKDPYTALVQMLTSLAHLATPSQYQRLRNNFSEARFAVNDPPRIDGYVLLYDFGKDKSTYLKELDRYAREISKELVNLPGMTPRLRRLACLDLNLNRGGDLHADCRWRYET